LISPHFIRTVDPQKVAVHPLPDMSQDRWNRHFAWQGPVLVGRTVAGRVTIGLLEINRPEAVELREYLIREST
jgi:hypothetical protein